MCLLVLSVWSGGLWSRPSPYFSSAMTLPKSSWLGALSWREFITKEELDHEGRAEKRQGGEGYQRFEYEAVLGYGISRALMVRLGTQYRKNVSISRGGTEFGAAGLESVMLGLRYALAQSARYSFAWDVEARQLLAKAVGSPLEADEGGRDQAGNIALGDEGQFFRIGLAGDWQWGEKFLVAGDLGVVAPAKDQSLEAAFDVALYLRRRQFAIGLGVEGVVSLGGDEFSDAPEQKPLKAAGLTATINSVNRSYTEAYGRIDLALSDGWSLQLLGGQTIAGASWDNRLFAQAGIVYRSVDKTVDRQVKQQFNQYAIEGEVTKVSSRGGLIKVNRGLSHGVAKGMRFDIYRVDYVGGNVLIAAGRVFKVGASACVVKLLKFFTQGAKIEQGYVARGREQ